MKLAILKGFEITGGFFPGRRLSIVMFLVFEICWVAETLVNSGPRTVGGSDLSLEL